MSAPSKKQEWATGWPLALVAMLGTGGAGMYAYTNGVFMESLTQTFGWTRAQFSAALMLQMILGVIAMPIVGRLVDRFGPRRIALTGIPPFVIATALLAFANGSVWQWYALCLLLALFSSLISPVVWITAVAGRFHSARGMALAITLAGSGIGASVWPVLAAVFISEFGWRNAFPALALSWGAIVLPLAIACFFGAQDRPGYVKRVAAGPAERYTAVLRSRTFIFLALAGGLYGSISLGLMLHLVPILREGGLGMTTAASIAGFSGLCVIVGRVGTGVLLDMLPTRPLSVFVFLMPIAAAALLVFSAHSIPLLVLAVAILGLSAGAEYDIITYVAAREFPPQIFASVYAVMGALLAVCASAGPVLASALYDARQSYDLFLAMVTPIVIASTILIALIPQRPQAAAAEEAAAVS